MANTKTTTFEADPQVIEAVDAIVEPLGLSRSWFIRQAISEKLNVVSVGTLPFPPGAHPVPVVTVSKVVNS